MRALRAIAGVVGIVLTVVMAGAYFAYAVQHAWSSWQTYPLFVVGALALGAAVIAVLDEGFYVTGPKRSCAVALYALFAVAAALEAAHFAGVGASGVVPLAVGAIAAVVAAALPFAMKQADGKTLANAELAVAFVAVAVARYGFYMAYAG